MYTCLDAWTEVCVCLYTSFICCSFFKVRNVRKGTEKRSVCSALALSVNKFSTRVESMEQADLETVLACVMMACVVP